MGLSANLILVCRFAYYFPFPYFCICRNVFFPPNLNILGRFYFFGTLKQFATLFIIFQQFFVQSPEFFSHWLFTKFIQGHLIIWGFCCFHQRLSARISLFAFHCPKSLCRVFYFVLSPVTIFFEYLPELLRLPQISNMITWSQIVRLS